MGWFTSKNKLEEKSLVQLVLSCSMYEGDKANPFCVRVYPNLDKNHSFSRSIDLYDYVIKTYGSNFEIIKYEHFLPDAERILKERFNNYRLNKKK